MMMMMIKRCTLSRYVFNIHGLKIRPRYVMYTRNPKYTTFTKLVQVRNFIIFELKVIRHEERETQSFYADCFYIFCFQSNRPAAPVAHKVVWPRPALKVNLLLPRQKLNSLLFLKSQPTLPVRDVTQILWSQFLSGLFYFDISEWHILSARAWTPALMLHLTNPCAMRKVLSLTKPKGMIYKTKSLGNYITRVPFADR